LSRTGQVRLGVFGAHGERVRSLVNADHEAGPHEISWDGRDDQGRRVGPGVYFVRLDAEGRSLRQVVTLLH
jgi:flagellar hook assembly protein FlgD